MATGKFSYAHGQTHPGESGIWNPADMMFPPGSPFYSLASELPGRIFGDKVIAMFGAGIPYATGEWTSTTTGTSAAFARDTGGGLLSTCGSSSTFNTNEQSITLWTPVVNKRVVCAAQLQASDITTVGFEFNIGSSQVDPGTTNYTDVFGVKMKVGDGAVVGKVRGDSGVQALVGASVRVAAAAMGAGASSTTQAMVSTAGMVVGDILYFATTKAYRTIVSISSPNVVVDATISTTTGELVTCYAPLTTAVAATDLFVAFEFGFIPKSADQNTKAGTGASSATQAFASTLGMQPGDLIYYGTSAVYRSVLSITNATTAVLDTTVSTTTGEAVTVYGVEGSFWAGADAFQATQTPITVDAKVQLGRFMQTPVSVYCNLHAKGSAGNPTVLWQAGFAEVDR